MDALFSIMEFKSLYKKIRICVKSSMQIRLVDCGNSIGPFRKFSRHPSSVQGQVRLLLPADPKKKLQRREPRLTTITLSMFHLFSSSSPVQSKSRTEGSSLTARLQLFSRLEEKKRNDLKIIIESNSCRTCAPLTERAQGACTTRANTMNSELRESC